ncbi:cyclin-dependent protein kinase inhibitor SMR3 [Corylus avellana]|uniref:cyclin-dependent protein kinase inhibitor SMR3 n=1 Tax=Corylus avellana TaxID=13451 RepID=UPI001E2184CC|nr:cyclin-dependent protein kinase inhibitor SMR3 [Corylus avellana]
MSNDHTSKKNLPKLQSLQFPNPKEQQDHDDEGCRTPTSGDFKIPTVQKNLPKLQSLQFPNPKDQQDDDDDDNEGCRTPTSVDSKIPTVQSCPPTPRKRPGVFVNKRKWTGKELHFFETTRREELESFFQSSFEFPRINSHAVKRRCTSV